MYEVIHLEDFQDSSEYNQMLSSMLDFILELPWLRIKAGGIFIADSDGKKLNLVAEVNLSSHIKSSCSTVRYGDCLCGQVAESKNMLYASCINERCETKLEDTYDHGRFIFPIKINDCLFGVLTLYIDENYAFDKCKISVIKRISNVIALLIQNTKIRQEKNLTDLILEKSTHGLIITDRRNNIVWVNSAFEKVSGYSLDEVIGKTPAILSSGEHSSNFYAEMWDSVNKNGFWEGEVWNKNKKGEIYPELLNIIALRNDEGEVLRYAAMFIDITQLKSAESEINRLAYYDRLTGLPNIFLLQKELLLLVDNARKNNNCVVTFNIDLDYFKEINEGLGRDIGDGVLKTVAKNIVEFMPDNAFVSRFDGDEFIVAIPMNYISHENIIYQVSKLADSLNEEMLKPIYCLGHEIRPSCSIGIACYPVGVSNEESLLKCTSIALSHSKDSQRGSFKFYDEKLEKKAEYRVKLGLGISRAIENNELHLVYQPQVDSENSIIGAEVLLRWESKEFGTIPPDVFIKIAEEKNIILDIGRWVFSQAINQMRKWIDTGLCKSKKFRRLAINVSAHQILSDNMVSDYMNMCYQSELSTSLIEIEITETGMMSFSDNIIDRLKSLSNNGFTIAIDDFGTGFSSLSRLSHFPVNILKIDRSFVCKMISDKSQAAIVEYIINMAHALNMQVIAEGVETLEQVNKLKEYGCDIFQGYYYSKPLISDDFNNLLINADKRLGN